jgi:hypothetical protein
VGWGAQPGITVTPITIAFPATTPYGGISAPQTLTVTNTGAGSLQLVVQLFTEISAVQYASGSSDYLESDNCGTSLAAAATCTITVTFEPVSPPASCTLANNCNPQTPSAFLVVQNNAPGGAQKISLTADTGMGPIVSVSPNPIVFPPQVAGTGSGQNVSIFNLGDVDLVPSNMTIGGPNAAEFQLAQSNPNTCGSPIATASYCYVILTFTPAATATGTRTATLNITDSAIDSPQSIPIVGTVATSAPGLIVSPTSATLGPSAIGSTLNLSDGYYAPFFLTNPSTSSTQLTADTLGGANPGDFIVSPTLSYNPLSSALPLTIAPGATFQFWTIFNPTSGSDGLRTATLTFATNPAVSGLPVVQLQGIAVTNTDPALGYFSSPSPLDFGSAEIGQSSVAGANFIQLENHSPTTCAGSAKTCGGPLTITSLNFGLRDYSIAPSAYSSAYSYCTNAPLTIPAGAGCDFSIVFTPTQAGSRNTTLTINSNSPGGPASVPITGIGLALPLGNLSVNSLNFGYDAIGVPSPPLTVSLQNTGAGNLTVSGAAGSTNFAVVSNTCTIAVAPGGSCTIGVTFTPPSAGGFSGTLTISENNAFTGQQVVSLSGIGATGPSLLITPNDINFGNQSVNNASPAQAVTLSNSGDTAVSFPANAFAASANFVVANTSCPASLAPGASCAVSVQFKPAAMQAETGTLLITDGARGNPQTLYLTGTGVQSGSTPSTTTLTSSLNPATLGQPVTFTATVAGATNAPVPTGSVNFLDGSTVLGSAALNGSAQASFKTSSLSAGSHSITAVYGADATYATSTSAALNEVVNPPAKVTSTTTLMSSENPAKRGDSVIFTATVAGVTANTPVPTGSVNFLDGSTTLGSGTLNGSGQAAFTTSSLTAGSHSISAVYSSDTNYAASTSATLTEVVNAPALAATTTTLASSANPATTGQSITFSATVAGSAGGAAVPTGNVTFVDGATTLGSGALNSSAIATLETSALTQGSHPITAQYAGDTNYLASTSSVLIQTVNAPASFSVSASPAALTVTQGQSGSTSLSVASAGGFSQPVSLSCSGLPQYATCSFSPASVTPAANSTASTMLTIATDVQAATYQGPRELGLTNDRLGYALIFGVGLSAMLRRRRLLKGNARFFASIVIATLAGTLLIVGAAGCGGGGGQPSALTPKGTSSVTVTGTAGAEVQGTSISVTVQSL